MTKFYDMAEIIRRNERAGFHFFDPDSKRFFRSRIGSTVYQGPGGIFFTTSERFEGSTYTAPRRYTLRRFDPETGHVGKVGEFNVLSRSQAVRLAKKAAAGAVGPRDIDEWRKAREAADQQMAGARA
mgnify:CR=1 FL=1